jgi:peptide/nickel transport system permease protein
MSQSPEIRQAWPESLPLPEYPALAEEELEAEGDERHFMASQWHLMLRRFTRNRAAVIGAIIVILFYLTALFASFIAPYSLEQRFDQYLYVAPQRVHIYHDGDLGFYVYGL